MNKEKSSQIAKLEVIYGRDKGKEILLSKDSFFIGRDPDCDLVLDLPSISGKELSIENKQGEFLLRSVSGKEISVTGEKVTEKILETDDIITIGNIELKFAKTVLEEVKEGKRVIREKIFSKWLNITIFALLALIAFIFLGGDLMLYLEKKILYAKKEKAETETVVKAKEKKTPWCLHQEDVVNLYADALKRIEIGDDFYEDRKQDDSYIYKAIYEWQTAVDLFSDYEHKPRLCHKTMKKIENAQTKLDNIIKYLKNNAYAAYKSRAKEEYKATLERIMRYKPITTDKDYIWAKKKYIQLSLSK